MRFAGFSGMNAKAATDAPERTTHTSGSRVSTLESSNYTKDIDVTSGGKDMARKSVLPARRRSKKRARVCKEPIAEAD